MKAIPTDKAIIISLIKDHLINYKLVSNLSSIGLNADDYFLQLSHTIFTLMGLNQVPASDRLFDKFMEYSRAAIDMDFSRKDRSLDELSNLIYERLIAKRNPDA